MRAPPKKMPHLMGAKKLRPFAGQKLCFHETAGFVLDIPGSEFVCGTFRAATPEEAALFAARGEEASQEPMIHAWAEWQGKVWSPTTMRVFEPDFYYRINGASDIRRISRPALLKLARETGMSRALRLGLYLKNGESFGGALMRAAGKAYRVENGAVLPALGEEVL